MVQFAVNNSTGPWPRVLVADDAAAIRTLLMTLLTRKEFEVETVRNGAEAIQKIAESSCATILLDFMIPIASVRRSFPSIQSQCERTAVVRRRSASQ